MNIFVFSFRVAANAESYCDQHVIKIILEITQLLYCTVWMFAPDLMERAPNGGYKKTHVNHPINVWVRRSEKNWLWALSMGLALCDEFNYRGFKKGEDHLCKKHLLWLQRQHKKGRLSFEEVDYTPFAQAMPEEYKIPGDTRSAYKRYVREKKSSFKRGEPRWTNRPRPAWW